MDIGTIATAGTALVMATAFVVTFAVLGKETRDELRNFKNTVESRFNDMDARFESRFNDMDARFESRFSSVEHRLGRLEVDVAEIKAICRERSNKDTPA